MQIDAYVVTEERVLVPIEAGEMSDDWFLDDTVRWIKITSATPQDIEKALRPLELHPKIIEACANPLPPQVEVFEKVLFMAMPLWSPDATVTLSFRFACVATTLITIQDEPIDFIEELAKRLQGDRHLLDVNTAALTCHLVEATLKAMTPVYLTLRVDANTTAETLETTPGEVETDDLHALKYRATLLSNLLEDYLFCLEELQEAQSDTLQLDTVRANFQEFVGSVQRAQILLARMEDRIRDLRQLRLNYVQEATSRRLNILAVLSAIYLPSTLIAGIYGMNFDHIPITEIPHGYIIVLIFMLSLVVGQVCFFYVRGWFK